MLGINLVSCVHQKSSGAGGVGVSGGGDCGGDSSGGVGGTEYRVVYSREITYQQAQLNIYMVIFNSTVT